MLRWILVACAICIIILDKATTPAEAKVGLFPHGFKKNMIVFGRDDGNGRLAMNALNDTTGGNIGSSSAPTIINGEDIPIGAYPYVAIVLVKYYGYFFFVCSGVIYNRYTIITAAHCLRYIDYLPYYVALGIQNITAGADNPGSQLIKVDSHTIHPGWDASAPGYPDDIALLHLDCLIEYIQCVKAAQFATKYEDHFENTACYMVGWGYTGSGLPQVLQTAWVYAIDNYLCSLFWRKEHSAKILGTHFCTYRYPVSACFGDGGGPVVCDGKVAGIISWGRLDCSGCDPEISTRMSRYLDWIEGAATMH